MKQDSFTALQDEYFNLIIEIERLKFDRIVNTTDFNSKINDDILDDTLDDLKSTMYAFIDAKHALSKSCQDANQVLSRLERNPLPFKQ